MSRVLRIGTRDSELAVWQALQVKDRLQDLGETAELIHIKSAGDQDLHTPLYQIGTVGIFTRALDSALLEGSIDLAVHSLKDVPTEPAEGIIQVAVLSRGPANDVLVCRKDLEFLENPDYPARIATGSLRRKAQWLNRYPRHEVFPIRGNVRSRLKKLQESNWDGAIFAQAGLERIGAHPDLLLTLNWMLPAPAQGAVVVMARDGDTECFEWCRQFNDQATTLCVRQERDFLKGLEGGCAAPIGAWAWIEADQLHLKGNILSPDGKQKLETETAATIGDSFDLGKEAAAGLMVRGAGQILSTIRNGTS
ncbi:MAG TPA: hydroxymethylbilane synthase [Chitinophagaceae bacterium]|nr:hydroxymethylbilane synthase [Chitinophagaceae bacterium]